MHRNCEFATLFFIEDKIYTWNFFMYSRSLTYNHKLYLFLQLESTYVSRNTAVYFRRFCRNAMELLPLFADVEAKCGNNSRPQKNTSVSMVVHLVLKKRQSQQGRVHGMCNADIHPVIMYPWYSLLKNITHCTF